MQCLPRHGIKSFRWFPRFSPSIIVEYAAANLLDIVKTFHRFSRRSFIDKLFHYLCSYFFLSFARTATKETEARRERKALIEAADRLQILGNSWKALTTCVHTTNFARIFTVRLVLKLFTLLLREGRLRKIASQHYQRTFISRTSCIDFSWAVIRVLQGINLPNGKVLHNIFHR